MGETVKKITDQVLDVWKGMNFNARFMTVVFAVGVVVGLALWVHWLQKEEYGLLHSGKNTKEVGEVVNYLRDNGIPYRIKHGGKSVYVPTERIYDTKLNLATEGLLDDDVGFEMFDKVKFGVTSFAQKVNYRRALQGELAKTISQLDPIDTAKVQVVLPDESLFLEEKREPTASVVLKLKARRSLSQLQIAGIVQLVSSAVEGLDNSDVTIADNQGNLLTFKESSSMISKNNEKLDMKRRIEDYYASKATEIVTTVIGSRKVVVKVSADMEYKNVSEKHVIYDPNKKVPRTQRIITRVSGGPSRRGGSPGTDSNIRQVGLVQEVGSSEEEETIQTQYDTSKVERLVSQDGGVLQRLTVAILVDGKYETVEEDGESIRRYVPLDASTLTSIGALVRNTLGISDVRGDSLEVKNLQFSDDGLIEHEEIAEVNPYIKMVMDNISLIITMLTFMIFAFVVVKKMRARVERHVMLIDQGVPVDAAALAKGAVSEKELVKAGKPLDAAEKDVDAAAAESALAGAKEGKIKSAAMKALLDKPGKEINEDLEVFKEDIRRATRQKVDGAVVILKRWLAQ